MDLLQGSGSGSGSSTNVASCGGDRGRSNSGGNGGCGHGRGGFNAPGGRSHGHRDRSSNFEVGIFCQICGKEGHHAIRCFKRFDASYTVGG
jgi:hypothetical protein